MPPLHRLSRTLPTCPLCFYLQTLLPLLSGRVRARGFQSPSISRALGPVVCRTLPVSLSEAMSENSSQSEAACRPAFIMLKACEKSLKSYQVLMTTTQTLSANQRGLLDCADGARPRISMLVHRQDPNLDFIRSRWATTCLVVITFMPPYPAPRLQHRNRPRWSIDNMANVL